MSSQDLPTFTFWQCVAIFHFLSTTSGMALHDSWLRSNERPERHTGSQGEADKYKGWFFWMYINRLNSKEIMARFGSQGWSGYSAKSRTSFFERRLSGWGWPRPGRVEDKDILNTFFQFLQEHLPQAEQNLMKVQSIPAFEHYFQFANRPSVGFAWTLLPNRLKRYQERQLIPFNNYEDQALALFQSESTAGEHSLFVVSKQTDHVASYCSGDARKRVEADHGTLQSPLAMADYSQATYQYSEGGCMSTTEVSEQVNTKRPHSPNGSPIQNRAMTGGPFGDPFTREQKGPVSTSGSMSTLTRCSSLPVYRHSPYSHQTDRLGPPPANYFHDAQLWGLGSKRPRYGSSGSASVGSSNLPSSDAWSPDSLTSTIPTTFPNTPHDAEPHSPWVHASYHVPSTTVSVYNSPGLRDIGAPKRLQMFSGDHFASTGNVNLSDHLDRPNMPFTSQPHRALMYGIQETVDASMTFEISTQDLASAVMVDENNEQPVSAAGAFDTPAIEASYLSSNIDPDSSSANLAWVVYPNKDVAPLPDSSAINNTEYLQDQALDKQIEQYIHDAVMDSDPNKHVMESMGIGMLDDDCLSVPDFVEFNVDGGLQEHSPGSMMRSGSMW